MKLTFCGSEIAQYWQFCMLTTQYFWGYGKATERTISQFLATGGQECH